MFSVDGVPLTEATIAVWAEHFQLHYGQVRRVRVPTLSARERYAHHLTEYYSMVRRVVDEPVLPADIQLKEDFVA